MIAVWIILSFLALILILLLLPVTVSAAWEGRFLIKVRYAGIPVYSNQPKTKPRQKTPRKSASPEKTKSAPKKKNIYTVWREKHGFTGAVHRTAGIIKIILRRTAWFVRRMELRKLRLRITVASPDAAQTAIEYGAVCAAVYPLLTFLFTLIDCRAKSVDLSADFDAEKPDVALSLLVHTKLWYALCTVLIGLLEYYKYKDVDMHE